MAKLKRRKIEEVTEKIKKDIEKDIEKKDEKIKQTLSTGSTLLDLIISGKRKRGGGIPGGYVLEIYGPSGSGKTAILAELSGSAQANGGEARFDDPEARLDKEYSKIYGFDLKKDNYHRPDTVKEMFAGLWDWEPKNKDAINVSCADSLAALSTEMEMDDEDKMGMKRAKDFSEGLRKTCRVIANNNWILACSNQERHGGTPGGKAIPYYSSLRIRISPEYTGGKIEKNKKVYGVDVKKVTGIRCKCQIVKNSIDEPYGECNVSIVFGYGIDDIRENLIYTKQYTGSKKYICPDTKEWATINKAIEHIENFNLEDQLKEQTINLWYEIQEQLKIERKPKDRKHV